MQLEGCNLGIAITGSFCTFSKLKPELYKLKAQGANLIPVFSFHASSLDTRFGKADEFIKEIEEIAQRKAITTIEEAEPLGPKGMLDVLVIMPCTGNTMAKLCHGITDTPVLMAAKAHMRNNKPLVISLSTNDALGFNLQNIGILLNTKEIYFVPFGQDDYEKKPKSMTACMELAADTIEMALEGKQLQPLLQLHRKSKQE